MINPFTKFLSQWSTDQPFAAFVEKWDRLEQVVIGVYRGKIAHEDIELEYATIWPWLRQEYDKWNEALRPYWLSTRSAGRPTESDPFRSLLGINATAEIPGNWHAMQLLPAAREAINLYILEHSENEGG